MDERSELALTRRNVLGSIGVVGAGAALGGAGTTAFFSDEEQYQENRLVAGSLDLKVDWEEHYSDWSADEAEYAEMAADPGQADYLLPALQPVARLRNGDYPEGAPFGSLQFLSDARPIALNFIGPGTLQENKDAFWDTTSIEAYPDVDDDGIQDAFGETYEVGNMQITVGDVCDAGADTPEDLDPTVPGALRSQNEDTVAEADGYKPLVSLDDVKPGDFGEITFSFHLCDNDGYVWMNGELVENDEVSVTEPERKDPHEDQTEDDPEDDFDGELAQSILTRMWYDEDCDNQVDGEFGDLDLMLAIDTSGSIRGEEQDQMRDGVNAFIDELPQDGTVQVGSLTFGDEGINNLNTLTDPGSLTVDLPGFSGNTPLPAALDIADQVVRNGPNARAGAQKAIVVFTDGGPNYQNHSYGTDGYVAPRDETTAWSAEADNDTYDNADAASATVSEPEMAETAGVAESVRDGTSRIATVFVGEEGSTDAMTDPAIATYTDLPTYLSNHIASPGFGFTVAFADLESLAAQLVQTITVGEEVFFLGPLDEALARLSQGNGIPLDGDLETAFDELADEPNDEDRECFAASSTHCIGLEWWLPMDHANQIQTDSVQFDIGFYGEQCRHNDGSGMEQEQEVDA